jgi:hypothetical protein
MHIANMGGLCGEHYVYTTGIFADGRRGRLSSIVTTGLLHFNSAFSEAGYVDTVQRSFMKSETAAGADQSDVAARGKADDHNR